MSTGWTSAPRETPIHTLGRSVLRIVEAVGDLALFSWQMVTWMLIRLPRRSVVLPCMYQVGVKSIPVVIVTGAFIGWYWRFRDTTNCG